MNENKRAPFAFMGKFIIPMLLIAAIPACELVEEAAKQKPTWVDANIEVGATEDLAAVEVVWFEALLATSYSILECSSDCDSDTNFTVLETIDAGDLDLEVGFSTTVTPSATVGDEITFIVRAENAAGNTNSNSATLAFGLRESTGVLELDTQYADFLEPSTGTIFSFDMSAVNVDDIIYFWVNGGDNDTDVTVYHLESDAEADNTDENYSCGSGLSDSCYANGSGSASEEIALTVTDTGGTLYVRVWNYASVASVVTFGVATETIADNTTTDTQEAFTDSGGSGSGINLVIEALPTANADEPDTKMEVFQSDGSTLESSCSGDDGDGADDDSGTASSGLFSLVSCSDIPSGTYYIRIFDEYDEYGAYSISVRDTSIDASTCADSSGDPGDGTTDDSAEDDDTFAAAASISIGCSNAVDRTLTDDDDDWFTFVIP